MTPRRIAVVGAGITGLALAHRLASRAAREGVALELAVFEAGSRPGGHARTVIEDGYLIEGGPNGFLDRSPAPLEMIRELGLDGAVVEARPEAARRFILRGGRLCMVPDAPPRLLTSPALSWAGKLRLLGEAFVPAKRDGVDETVFDFARRRIGEEAATYLVDAAVSGITAGDSKTLSLQAAFPLMVEMERDHGSLIKAMMARRKEGKGPARLLSFQGGLQQLAAAAARALGASLRLDTPLGRIEPAAGAGAGAGAGPGWRLVRRDGTAEIFDQVLLALPARAAAPLVEGLDAALAGAFAAIPYSSTAVVALAYRKEDVGHALDGYGYLTTRPENTVTLGCVWESSLFEGRAPADMALLRVILGGPRNPGIATAAAEEQVATARREFERVIPVRAAPVRTWTFSWPRSIAQYTLGHLDRLGHLRGLLARHPGLEICGTSYEGVAFGSAIESGRRLADRILDSRSATPSASGVEVIA
jgi:oxygen-dependent protoporphyrinogen oxidase